VYEYGFNLLSNQDGQKSERACTRYLSYLIILYYANNSSLIFPLLKRIRHSAGRMTYRMPGDFPFITPAPPAGLDTAPLPSCHPCLRPKHLLADGEGRYPGLLFQEFSV
jgi:hypothetical protein